jgi:hypothetical protein
MQVHGANHRQHAVSDAEHQWGGGFVQHGHRTFRRSGLLQRSSRQVRERVHHEGIGELGNLWYIG